VKFKTEAIRSIHLSKFCPLAVLWFTVYKMPNYFFSLSTITHKHHHLA